MSWWRAIGRSPANSSATTREAKCVLSSDSTRTSAPGKPARIRSAMRSGVIGVEFMGASLMRRDG